MPFCSVAVVASAALEAEGEAAVAAVVVVVVEVDHHVVVAVVMEEAEEADVVVVAVAAVDAPPAHAEVVAAAVEAGVPQVAATAVEVVAQVQAVVVLLTVVEAAQVQVAVVTVEIALRLQRHLLEEQSGAMSQEMDGGQPKYIIVSTADQQQQQQPFSATDGNMQLNAQNTEDCGAPVEQVQVPIPYPSMPDDTVSNSPIPIHQEIPSMPSPSPEYHHHHQQQQQPTSRVAQYSHHRAAAVATKTSSSPPQTDDRNDDDENGFTRGSGMCNSAELQQLMDAQMVAGDANESKRRIHSTANSRTMVGGTTTKSTSTSSSGDEFLGLRQLRNSAPAATAAASTASKARGIDVICAPGVFSYRISTDLYCEHFKRNITCFAYLQQP
uniref:Ground-like domain-containing protein n=1 Tax=Globodera pallida TaxID=36090 RepID=A0A183CA86_GLOPA